MEKRPERRYWPYDGPQDEVPVVYIGREKVACRGLSDRGRLPPYLSILEASFVEARRARGWPDAAIAKALGCSIHRLNSKAVPREELTPREIEEQRVQAERQEQYWAWLDRKAQREAAKEAKAHEDQQRRAALRGEATAIQPERAVREPTSRPRRPTLRLSRPPPIREPKTVRVVVETNGSSGPSSSPPNRRANDV